ncbi:MAG: sigma-70 family RNA polymerase sigma factor [Leptospiraceae bacterium]|nr:sigma-70 family RNA polymerase sigma factor [Leptospiraceae bacterium]
MNADLNQTVARLYAEHRADLYTWLVRSVRNEEVAMDLLQDVFLNFHRIFQDKPLPPGDIDCRKYLFKAARNIMINHTRSAYQRRVELVENYDSSRADADQGGQSPEQLYLRNLDHRESEAVLQAVMAELSEEYRSLLQLRYHAKMRLEDIAEIMGLGLSTVSRQIKKAERQMRSACQKRGYRFSANDKE